MTDTDGAETRVARQRSVQIEKLGLPDQLDEDRPKGDQIREHLQDLADRLGPGASMPSDRQLSNHFGVARMTVRTELSRLIADGVLATRRGSGTYVTDTPRIPYEWGTSYSLATQAEGGSSGAQLLTQMVVSANKRLSEALEIPVGSRALHVVRLRTLDGVPIGIEDVTLPLAQFPGLEHVDLENNSLYQALSERWDVHRVVLGGSAVAALPSKDEAERLGITVRDPCIVIQMESRDDHDRVFEVGRAIYRGDRYQLAIHQDTRVTKSAT